jgi:opine dehydrogenase
MHDLTREGDLTEYGSDRAGKQLLPLRQRAFPPHGRDALSNQAARKRPAKAHRTVAVLGAGHGGLALAGHLSQRGFRVALWNRSLERLAPVMNQGGIHLSMPGGPSQFVPLAVATCRIATALAQSDRVLVAAPASAHADIARACAPYLRDSHVVLLLPGRTGGALEFQRVLREAGCRATPLIGEANTFPFAARCVVPGKAAIFGAKSDLMAAALPAQRTAELIAACRPIFPMLRGAESVLHTGLANVGAILHPVITLLNAARIKAGDSFDFYAHGVTPAVAETLAAADAERIRIASAYGVQASSLQAWIAEAYGHHAESVLDAIGGNPAYAGIKAPTTLVHRYLLEDVPTGLVPLLELGRAAGVAAPTLTKLVQMAQMAVDVEPWTQPRTLASLGLEGLTTAQVRARVEADWAAMPATAAAERRYSPSAVPMPASV